MLIDLIGELRSIVTLVIGFVRDLLRSSTALATENALLRQQLIGAKRHLGQRPKVTWFDRLRIATITRLVPRWPNALLIVQPRTVLKWRRDIFKSLWRRRSRRRRLPQFRITAEVIAMIQEMAKNNRLWGAERIRGELLKLAIRVSKTTVQRHMRVVRPPGEHGPTWATFLKEHAKDIWACDLVQTYDALFQPIFAFFIVKHDQRELVHIASTRHPTDAWLAQQLREATPWGEGRSI